MMSKDLIERLREIGDTQDDADLANKAADRIEQLEAELAATDQATVEVIHVLKAELAERYETIAQLQRNAIDALKAQAQEPVAWQEIHDNTCLYYRKPVQGDVRPLYTAPPPSAEDAKDAARYQWLKANANNGFDPSEDVQLIVSGDIGADAAIDAARGEGN